MTHLKFVPLALAFAMLAACSEGMAQSGAAPMADDPTMAAVRISPGRAPASAPTAASPTAREVIA